MSFSFMVAGGRYTIGPDMSQRAPADDRPRQAGSAKPGADRLASWKEIGAYLGVTARTAQRWERLEGLPVRRQMHATLGSAYALRHELDAWRVSRPDPRAGNLRPAPASRSIAVLPFANLTRDLETEILADGLTEELISTLAQVPGLAVVARTSSFYFKDKNPDIREVGEKLGVESVLEGSVRKVGDRIRVVAQLIDARSGMHLWSEPFDSRRPDLLGLQLDVAHAVAGILRGTGAPDRSRVHLAREDSSAYGRYLEGLYHFNRRTPDGFLKAVECFEQAVADDPRLAVAWSTLAACYGNATVTTTLEPAKLREKAQAFARRALAIDPDQAEAEMYLGGIDAIYSFDWKPAESHFLRAIALKPNLAEAHFFYAAFVLGPSGRLGEAESHHLLARQLDPLSAVIVNGVGMLRLMQRRYQESAAAFRATLDLDPGYPWAHRGLGEIAILEGRYSEALDALQRVEMPGLAAGLTGYAQSKLGGEQEARLAIRRLEQSGHPGIAYQIAIIALGLGDADASFAWLERALAGHDIGVIWLPIDPIWDPLRHDGRFARLVARMGIEGSTMSKTPQKKAVRKPAAAEAKTADKGRELSDKELDKVAGGVAVVKRTRR